MRLASLPFALLLLALAACGDKGDDLDHDGVARHEDCDDDDPSVGLAPLVYQDADFDGYGVGDVTERACTPPNGWAAQDGDCDDGNGSVHPEATETCDGLDDDCNGQVDDGVTHHTFHADADGDGYGDENVTEDLCAPADGWVTDGLDCDDGNADVHPGATETCDGVDEDCNGLTDDGAVDPPTWYVDADGDGLGSDKSKRYTCDQPAGFVSVDGDCDDTDADVLGPSAWYRDADADGFGTSADTVDACAAPEGYVDQPGDCDDADPAVNPDTGPSCP